MAIIIGIALFFHAYFIRNRMAKEAMQAALAADAEATAAADEEDHSGPWRGTEFEQQQDEIFFG